MDRDIKLNTPAGTKLTTFEDDILDILAEEQDTMTMQFLFLKKEQSAERILLLIEDVLPSRLRTLFEAKVKVDKAFPSFPFHLGRIRTFFAKSDEGKKENDLDKYFLEMIDKVFKVFLVLYDYKRPWLAVTAAGCPGGQLDQLLDRLLRYLVAFIFPHAPARPDRFNQFHTNLPSPQKLYFKIYNSQIISSY